MKFRASKIFYVKTAILMIFLVSSIFVSFLLGRNFASTMMGEIIVNQKVQNATVEDQKSEDQYSPLASPRFDYSEDQNPRDEYQVYSTQKPDPDLVLEDNPDVQMSTSASEETESDSEGELFNLGEEGDDESAPTDEGTSVATDKVIESNIIYKVLVKTPGGRENAEQIAKLLKEEGYDPLIVELIKDDEKVYHVQIEALRNLDRANELAEELRRKNYNAWVKYSRI
jgi:cell division septation protein DedD